MSSHVCVPSWIAYVIDKHASKYVIIYPLPWMTWEGGQESPLYTAVEKLQ